MATKRAKRNILPYALATISIVATVAASLLIYQNLSMSSKLQTLTQERDTLNKDIRLYETAITGYLRATTNLSNFCQDTYTLLGDSQSQAFSRCSSIFGKNMSKKAAEAIEESVKRTSEDKE